MSRWIDPASAVVLLGVVVVGAIVLAPVDVPTLPESDGESVRSTEPSGEPSFTVDCTSVEGSEVDQTTVFVGYGGGAGVIGESGPIDRLYAAVAGAETADERTYFDLPADPGASVLLVAFGPPEEVVVVAEHEDGETRTLVERADPCEEA